ncbi:MULTISPECIES: AraC family transcriptional regulator [Vibrio]|uniref:Xylose operon regulatory protein n=1 Tax=Vibrio celticus TaxID=446372 RepID=A0A1C3JG49_9VIBR|nr:AraC family transcriptional regulator [Vibrio celticus]SBT14153.1 Xylose operon regulatory protein [Vibrio celticus]
MRPILEHVPNTEQQSLFFNRYEKTSFTFPWHYHPQWELNYIIEGTGSAYTGNTVRHFVANELALIAPNVPHCWKSNVGTQSGVKSIFVQWDNRFLGDNWLEKPEFTSIKTMFEGCKAGLSFHHSNALGSRIIELQLKSPFKRMLGFIDLLHDLSMQTNVMPLGQGSMVTPSMVADKRIIAILDYVSEHYVRKISAENMATLTNMTPVSFSKFFARTFGKTFTQFVNEYRISQACTLLISTRLTVEQIADQCGYQNMSFFHRQFKILQGGVTPIAFRASYLQVTDETSADRTS